MTWLLYCAGAATVSFPCAKVPFTASTTPVDSQLDLRRPLGDEKEGGKIAPKINSGCGLKCIDK